MIEHSDLHCPLENMQQTVQFFHLKWKISISVYSEKPIRGSPWQMFCERTSTPSNLFPF